VVEVKPFFHRSVRGSQSGFPLLTPIMETYDGPAWWLTAISWSAPFQGTMQAGQDSDGGGVDVLEGRCTLHAVVVLGICLGETWTVVETFLNTRW